MTSIRMDLCVIFLPLFSHVQRCSSIPELQIALHAALWSFVRASTPKACHQILPVEFVGLNVSVKGFGVQTPVLDGLVDNGKASLLRRRGHSAK